MMRYVLAWSLGSIPTVLLLLAAWQARQDTRRPGPTAGPPFTQEEQ